MEALRVDFTLSTPMSESAHPIHLDALVAWAAVEESREKGDSDPLLAQDNLPFDLESGIWCASALSFVDAAPPFTVGMIKKTSLPGFAEDRANGLLKSNSKRLDLVSGPWRQALFFQQCRYTTHATAWCVGDRRRIEALVNRISYLGAQRRLGRGRLESISVEKDSDASFRWRERVLAEPIDGYLPIKSPISPPYWDRRREISAWVHPNIV